MKQILQMTYPISESKKEIWLSSLGIALMAYLFLVVFQPFGTYNYTNANKYLLLAPYAVITFVTFSGGDLISARSKKWSWSREIIKIIILLSVCSFLNYWYSICFINNAGFSLRTLFYMGIFTFALGIPVCTIYFLGRYILLKSSANSPASETAETGNISAGSLMITPDAGEGLELSADDFICARSEGNYSALHYLRNGTVQKRLIRIPLKKLEEQICGQSIRRCHRSYIINTQKAMNKKGNAQGYRTGMEHLSDSIPISRKYADSILKLLK